MGEIQSGWWGILWQTVERRWNGRRHQLALLQKVASNVHMGLATFVTGKLAKDRCLHSTDLVALLLKLSDLGLLFDELRAIVAEASDEAFAIRLDPLLSGQRESCGDLGTRSFAELPGPNRAFVVVVDDHAKVSQALFRLRHRFDSR